MSGRRSGSVVALLRLGMLLGALVSGLATPAAAWPERTVTIITPTGAGGGSDTVARILAEQLAKRWHQPVIVENHPGGDGLPAIVSFLAGRGEHNLLFATTSAVTVNPLLHEQLPYDPRDLVPVSLIVDDFMAIAVSPDLGPGSLDELVALARRRRGELNYAIVPGAPALATLDWQRRQGIELVAVPYRNPIASVADLVAGRIQVGVMPLSVVLEQGRSGKLKLLALATERRAPAAEEIPTTGEAGDAAFSIAAGLGLFVPKQIQSALRERIADDVQAVLAEPAIREQIERLGYVPRGTRPTEFAAFLGTQGTKWADIARKHGLKPVQ